jgi:hypothetical protein
MTHASYLSSYVEIGRTYAALRQGGASRSRAGLELGLSTDEQHQLEALFRVRRPGLGCDAVRPRFARCAQHVAAVQRAGGYPVLRR